MHLISIRTEIHVFKALGTMRHYDNCRQPAYNLHQCKLLLSGSLAGAGCAPALLFWQSKQAHCSVIWECDLWSATGKIRLSATCIFRRLIYEALLVSQFVTCKLTNPLLAAMNFSQREIITNFKWSRYSQFVYYILDYVFESVYVLS